MASLTRASQGFVFHTRLHLSELTGLKAATLEQLVELLKEVPEACIYQHTHRFLQQHQYLSPEPPNDFAFWVSGTLGEAELGERLVSIDTMQFSNLASLREKTIAVIESYLKDNPHAKLRFSREGEEFHFIKAISFVLPTVHVVYDLKEFVEVLKQITFDSIYFHIFEARLRLGKQTNDFSYWIETSLGDKKLAVQIAEMDPYTRSLDDLRKSLIKMTEKRIKEITT